MKQKTRSELMNLTRTQQKREFDSVEHEFNLVVNEYWDKVEKSAKLHLKIQQSVKQLQEIKFYLVVNKEIKQKIQ